MVGRERVWLADPEHDNGSCSHNKPPAIASTDSFALENWLAMIASCQSNQSVGASYFDWKVPSREEQEEEV